MKEAAKLLGVELEEEFNIMGSNNNPHKLRKFGLFDCNGLNAISTLRDFLAAGKLVITKYLLTKEEKEYLESVLKPYKGQVEHITKDIEEDGVYLSVTLYRDSNFECFNLPYIKEEDIQYKRLESGKFYTLKDLGLFEGE